MQLRKDHYFDYLVVLDHLFHILNSSDCVTKLLSFSYIVKDESTLRQELQKQCSQSRKVHYGKPRTVFYRFYTTQAEKRLNICLKRVNERLFVFHTNRHLSAQS